MIAPPCDYGHSLSIHKYITLLRYFPKEHGKHIALLYTPRDIYFYELSAAMRDII